MSSKSSIKTILASMTGMLFIFYDFALFGFFAPILGKLFFPSSNKAAELIAAFGVFAAGFIIRPLGGIIFGHIGDKYGRKHAIVLAILMMSLPTGIIGILPTYKSVGIIAPLLLILMRMLQGISLGGNFGGSITFTLEHTSSKKRGLVGSLTTSSALVGMLLVSATMAVFSSIFSEESFQSWGWRIPFIFGTLVCVVGLYMRKNIDESPEFLKEQVSGRTTKHPLKDIFSHHKKVLLSVVLTVMLHDLSFYVLFVYMTTYLTNVLNIAENLAFTINTLNLIVFGISCIISASLSDKFARKKVLSFFAVLLILTVIPMMTLITTENPVTIFVAQFILAIGAGGFFGPIPAIMVEAYPTRIRFSAVSLTTNISGPLFGGTAPMLITWLIDVTETRMVAAYYLTFAAVFSLIAIQFIKKHTIQYEK